MHFTIVGEISKARVLAAGPSVRLRRHLVAKFGRGRWRKMAGEATIQLPDGTVERAELHWFEAHGKRARVLQAEEEPGLLMKTSRARADSFVVCIHRERDDVDLIVGKVYRVMRAERHDRATDIRVIDESGDDYLYPRAWFVRVALPLKARKVLTAAV